MAGTDSGNPRYWIFVPGNGMWLVPAERDPEEYAQAHGTAVLFYGTVKDRAPVRRYIAGLPIADQQR